MKARLQSALSGSARKTGAPRLAAVNARLQDAMAASFGLLKQRLVQNRLMAIDSLQRATHVRWAADEASSIAWTTGFPLLTFPALFEELATAALSRAQRQADIHERSRELLGISMAATNAE